MFTDKKTVLGTLSAALLIAVGVLQPFHAANAWNQSLPPICTVQGTITANFNGTPIVGGNFIWFHSVMKLKSPTSGGTSIFFTHQVITFSANGKQYKLPVPDSEVIFSTTATTATTVFVGGGFITTVPATFGDNVSLLVLHGKFLQAIFLMELIQ